MQYKRQRDLKYHLRFAHKLGPTACPKCGRDNFNSQPIWYKHVKKCQGGVWIDGPKPLTFKPRRKRKPDKEEVKKINEEERIEQEKRAVNENIADIVDSVMEDMKIKVENN